MSKLCRYQGPLLVNKDILVYDSLFKDQDKNLKY